MNQQGNTLIVFLISRMKDRQLFRKMVRIKQQIPEDKCIELLKHEKRGVLSVRGDDDQCVYESG